MRWSTCVAALLVGTVFGCGSDDSGGGGGSGGATGGTGGATGGAGGATGGTGGATGGTGGSTGGTGGSTGGTGGATGGTGGATGGTGGATGGTGGSTGGTGGATGGTGGSTGGTGGATGGTGGATGGTGGATGGTGGATGGTGGTGTGGTGGGSAQAWLDNIDLGGVQAPANFEVDDTALYLVGTTGIVKVLKSDKSISTLVSGSCGNIGLTSTHVVAGCGTNIIAVPKSGGSPTTTVASQSPQLKAVDATDAYYFGSWSGQSGLYRVALSSGSPTPTLLAATSSTVSSLSPGALGGGKLYFNALAGVYSIPVTGGSYTLVSADSNPNAADIQVDGTTVFFARASSTTLQLLSAPAAGGNSTQILSQAGARFRVDGANLIHSGGSSPAVAKTPKTGGTTTPIATLPTQPKNLRLDATNTWVLAGTSPYALYKLSK